MAPLFQVVPLCTVWYGAGSPLSSHGRSAHSGFFLSLCWARLLTVSGSRWVAVNSLWIKEFKQSHLKAVMRDFSCLYRIHLDCPVMAEVTLWSLHSPEITWHNFMRSDKLANLHMLLSIIVLHDGFSYVNALKIPQSSSINDFRICDNF